MRRRIKSVILLLALVILLGACGKADISNDNKNPKPQSSAAQAAIGNNNNQGTNRIELTCNTQYPEYYEREVLNTIDSVQQKISADSINYIFITDLHMDGSENTLISTYRQLNAVVDVANNTDVDFVCVGGDLYDGRHAEENGKQAALNIIKSVSEILVKCDKPVFMLKGNHDDNSFSAQANGALLYDADYIIDNEEWYSATMEYFSSYAQGYQNGYYYYDLPSKDVRVICLNMSDSDDTVVDGKQNEMGMYFYGYKDEQINWLLNEAMSREDCRYVIMSHDAFDYPEGYAANSNRDTLKNLLTAAYSHSSYDDGKFKKDFSKWNSNLILFHCGHLHISRTFINEEMGGIPILNTEKSKTQGGRVWGSFGNFGYTATPQREFGTVSEALFDIVISTEGKMDVIRFGAGDDWQVIY